MWNVWMLHPVYHRVWWILLVLHLLLLLKDLLGNSIAIPGFQHLHLQHHVFATSTLLQGSACIADQARTHPVLPCTQPLLEQLGNDLPVLVVKKLTLKHVLFQKHIYIYIYNIYIYIYIYNDQQFIFICYIIYFFLFYKCLLAGQAGQFQVTVASALCFLQHSRGQTIA